MGESSFERTQTNCMDGITLLHFNAHSLLPKIDTLIAECLLHNPHVVCITETWLDNHISDNELSVPNYKIIRLDRSRHGGGVAIYVDSMFTHSILFTGNRDFECVIASLCANNSKFYVCVVYRPPNSK